MSARPYQLGRRRPVVEQNRDRIIRATLELLTKERSAADFSVESVARRAGVARMTIYYQFHSKSGLLEAVLDHLSGPLAHLPEAFSRDDPIEALDSIVDIFCTFWESARPVHRKISLLAAGDAELEAAIHSRNERRREGLDIVLGRLPGAKVRPEAVDILVDVLFVLTSFEAYNTLAASRENDDIARLIKQTAHSLVAEKLPET